MSKGRGRAYRPKRLRQTESIADRLAELWSGDRLLQNGHRPTFARFLVESGSCIAAHEDGGGTFSLFAMFVQQLGTALAGKLDVEDQAIYGGRKRGKKRLGRIEGGGLEAYGTEERNDRTGGGAVIVDYNDRRSGCHYDAAAGTGWGIGNSRRNVAPDNTGSSSSRVPPLASTIERLILNPIPMPSLFVV